MARKPTPRSVKAFFAHDPHRVLQGGMARTLGIRLVAVSRKKVAGEMRITGRHLNRAGRVNGGAIMAFADALGAVGTIANLPAGCRTTTLESKTNFFAAGDRPLLAGVSVPLHVGRTTNVWQTTIKNADGRMVAIVTQTQIVIPAAAEAARTRSKPKRARKRGTSNRQ